MTHPAVVDDAHLASARPILKWAGGKTQLLPELLAKLPSRVERYIEPFFGGGALFFALAPREAIIADINPELVNLYQQVAGNVDGVIEQLSLHENSESHFYTVRALDWTALAPDEAAARTIFLNKTCFNGLYRVNKRGEFNVPFAGYKDPRFLDAPRLKAASQALASATIVLGDYKTVLQKHAKAGDVVFLDPPYLPVSQYSDFRRYTKEQFYEDDHRELADEVRRLQELGARVLLTNSNHPLVHELFDGLEIEVHQTRRYVNAQAGKRHGEDVIVDAPPKQKLNLRLVPEAISDQAAKYPSTRYMGSKNKLLAEIWNVARQFDFDSAVDLFGGSGVVSYMFKAEGKRVISNDYMAMATTYAKAMIENSSTRLDESTALELVTSRWESDGFVSRTFSGLYFTDQDNAFIDNLRGGIQQLDDPRQRAIAMTALIRACMKKRPRGIFTYVGDRYDDGRKDLSLPFSEHFLKAVEEVNGAVFANGQRNVARNGDAMSVRAVPRSLVYIDPPYYTPLGDNEYVRRYHFVEGLARGWDGVEIQEHTLTKKFRSYPTPFSSRVGASEAFDSLFRRHRGSILLVSYSSNSLPRQDEIVSLMSKYKEHVEVIPITYRYSFGTQGNKVGQNRNSVNEYLFVGY